MKIIVTGAAGFIGSYLCRYLSGKGHTVLPMARTLPRSFLDELQPESHWLVDVTSDLVPEIQASADAVVHLASANEVVSKDVRKGLDISVIGTKNILDMAARNGIPKMVFFSTLQVYGTEPVGDLDENTPVAPVNDYALNHLFAEHYVELYARQGRLASGAVIRPANVFGRFGSEAVNRWTMVPACFCREAVVERTITIRSSGRQTRDFISLENVSRAVEAVCGQSPRPFDIINAASGKTRSIEEVALAVRKAYGELTGGCEAVIRKTGAEPQTSNRFTVSTAKLRNDYGFAPDESMTLEGEIAYLLSALTAKP